VVLNCDLPKVNVNKTIPFDGSLFFNILVGDTIKSEMSHKYILMELSKI
jgi:hypothetical protein